MFQEQYGSRRSIIVLEGGCRGGTPFCSSLAAKNRETVSAGSYGKTHGPVSELSASKNYLLFIIPDIFMKLLHIPVLILLIAIAGCTSVLPVQSGSQQPLGLDQEAHFENNGYAFSAAVTNTELKDNTTVLVTLTIDNTGKKAITLSAMPSVKDPNGQVSIGQILFFSQILPGYQSTQSVAIPLPEGSTGEGCVLDIRFQGVSPLPYEAAWDLDTATISP